MIKNEIKQKKTFGMVDSGILFSITVIAILIVPEIFRFIISLFVNGVVGSEGEAAEEIMSQTSVNIVIIIVRYAVLLTCVLVYAKKRNLDVVDSFGLNKKPDLLYTATTPFASFAMLFTFYPLSYFCMWALEKTGFEQQALNFFAINSGASLFAGIIVLCLIPAVCEELLFRGAILSGLKQKNNVFAILVSAMLFSLYHQNAQQTIYQFILGVILAYVVIKTGRVYISMLIHFFSNMAVVLVEFFNNTLPSGTGIGISMTSSDWIMFGIAIAILTGLVVFNVLYKKKPEKCQLDVSDIEVLEGAYPNKDEATSKLRTRSFWGYVSLGLLICTICWIAFLVMGFQ